MSRGRKLLVAGLAVIALTISTSGNHTVRAQESQGPTLSQRLSALGNAFKRSKSPSKPTAGRTTNGRPTYGSTPHSRPTASSNTRTHSNSRGSITDLLPDGLFGRKKSSAR